MVLFVIVVGIDLRRKKKQKHQNLVKIFNFFLHVFFSISSFDGLSREAPDTIYPIRFRDDVTITIDAPNRYSNTETIIILYTLPNGNTTEQTMGKKMVKGDDWHLDIQHIKARTEFIRSALQSKNIVVAYLENNLKSWPAWKRQHLNYQSLANKIVDTIYSIIPGKRKEVYLNGHSGGGIFIFSYIQSVSKIRAHIKRVGF